MHTPLIFIGKKWTFIETAFHSLHISSCSSRFLGNSGNKIGGKGYLHASLLQPIGLNPRLYVRTRLKPQPDVIMKSRLLYAAVLTVLLGGLFMSAAPEPSLTTRAQQSFFDRLVTPDITRFTLTFDIDGLNDMKRSDEYFPATFSHNGEQWEAELKVRGRYRRRVCDFPPLKLKLNKDMLEAAGLQRHNKFKLVTHCSDNFDNDDNVLREYLAYELYNLMTGEGYRTQLVEVTYQNANTGESVQRYGILIEDTDEMAQANGGEECDDCFNMDADRYEVGTREQVALFQYMIGNSDYGIRTPRNIKHVQQQAGGAFKVVPYDFDFAGLVNAEYAIPNPNYNQEKITDRIFVWEYDETPQLDATIQQFLNKEAEALNLVENFPNLTKRSKREISKYLGEFFDSLRDDTFQAGV